MGTRNLTMVISEGKTKIAQYGQWDGQPSGQGEIILEFLLKCDLDKLKERVDKLRWATDKEIKKIDATKDWWEKYPFLSRDCGGEILSAVYDGTMTVSDKKKIGERIPVKVNVEFLVNSEDFAAESLFCEWAYVIDLDKRTFEVYKGFNKKPLTEKDRFFKMSVKQGGDYNQVKMVKKYSLDKLPTVKDFLFYFKKKE